MDGLASKPYLGGQDETGIESTSGSCEHEDVFSI